MNAALLALKLIPLLLACSFGPGLLVVRRLRWSPLEKLCGAMAASFILTYLASFALFCLNAPAALYWAISIVFVVTGLLNWEQMGVFLRRSASRRTFFAFLAVLGWDFLHLAMIRHYGGGDWSGDWREHYDRTRYFLHLLPSHALFLDIYPVPARPPMMNLITAFYCGQVGINFEAFSLTSLFLNASAFVLCCLLLRHLAPRATRCIPILAILFMLNPSIMQNVTYTWTKAMSAGFVVAAVCFYLRGSRLRDGSRLVAAALCMAAAILIHYSAVPFAIAMAVHYAMTLAFKPIRGNHAIAAAAGLLATWFAWSIAVFGLHQTLFSNSTTAGTVDKSLSQNIARDFYNVYTTLVPHMFHPVSPPFRAVHTWGDVRDYYFLMSQVTLPMMIGCTAGFVAAFLLVRFFRLPDPRITSEKRFWMFFVVFTFIVGIAVNPDRTEYGAAHVTLQPLGLMGVALVAAWLPKVRPVVFWIVMAGAAIDYCLGILLHFDRLSYVYPTMYNPQSGLTTFLPDTLGWGRGEFIAKLLSRYTFWGDELADVLSLLKLISIGLAGWALYQLTRLRGTCATMPIRKLP